MLLAFAPTALTPGTAAPAIGARAARNTAFSTFRHADATALPMEVCEGALPPWLCGSYRNGPGLFEAVARFGALV